ncbi:uncharacterized protein N7469_006191 [Penicillium citrinum]|uniref:Uncharacterized protein n=1 Tax=Penicillium citrinum TaxID=5077 RepID=A0A9W9NXH0_PENCI|nr:uncharacterized protein N7469_006191 [Penicillium citrinum]KAJ5231603.1 hypothetical protein N7469_006191 [Penicillium citrinum]
MPTARGSQVSESPRVTLKTTGKVPVFDGEKEFTSDPEWVDNREEGRRSHALAGYDWRWKMEALAHTRALRLQPSKA